MTNPYDDDLSRFAVTFMRAVIAWNNAESTARRILIAFGGRGIGLTVAAEHLGSVGLRDALNTLCDLLSGKEAPHTNEVAGHVAHFVEGFDVLRAYRNFYVHSLKFTGKAPDDPKTFRGFLHSVEAKGRFAFVEQDLSTEDLEDFMKHTLALQRYGSEISSAIPGGTNALNALAAYANLKPLSSIEKPTWPERLKKHRSYLGESSPQPESSGV